LTKMVAMREKTRYSEEELEEFRAIIHEKLRIARQEYENYRAAVTNTDGNDIGRYITHI